MEEEKKNKKGFYFWLDPEVDQQINAHLYVSRAKSRSEFVNEAIRRYVCELDSEMNKEYLSKELTDLVRANIKDSENHIAASLYKLAGEQATLNLLLADLLINNMDGNAIRTYRDMGYDIVRKRHGVFTFEDAMDDARAFAEGKDT